MKSIHVIILCSICLSPAMATVYLDDGQPHTINYTINDTVEIAGSGTHVSLVSGAYIGGNHLCITGDNSLNIYGGHIAGYLYPLANLPLHMYGGTVGGPISLDAGINGTDGDLYIHGTDFKIDGVPVAYGVYHQNGHLTGTLANGDLIDNDVWCAGSNDLILIPEPATLLLLAVGGLFLRQKRS